MRRKTRKSPLRADRDRSISTGEGEGGGGRTRVSSLLKAPKAYV